MYFFRLQKMELYVLNVLKMFFKMLLAHHQTVLDWIYTPCLQRQTFVFSVDHLYLIDVATCLGWARYQECIEAPALFLDGILVREDIETEVE